MSRHSSLLVPALAALLLLACSKSEADPSTQPPPSASSAPLVTASSVPSAAPSASAAEAASAVASAAPSAEPRAEPSKKGDASAAAVASAAPSTAECGTKPLPDCPLQAWMKSTMNPPVMKGDTAALAVTFDKVVAFAPPAYTNWVSISKDGSAAAKSGDLAAAKAACRTCHDQYKQKYKTEMRSRKI